MSSAYVLPQTPQRPLPGAYMQTPIGTRYLPGPGRQPPSHPNPGQLQQQSLPQIATQTAGGAVVQPSQNVAQPERPRTETLKPTERAARTINETLHKESRYPELDTYIGQGISSDYDTVLTASWAPFQKVRMYPIPDNIFLQYNRAQVSTMMGLFADLNHAWVTIDNALYLWDYTLADPPLVGFEEQPNSITAVCLTYPKAGVFVPAITRLLVVATTAEIILVGLSSEANSQGRTVSLYQTKMSIPIRGLDINIIEASESTGRIFFSGTGDNDVYELLYQQEEKWFSHRCGKICHTGTSLAALTPTWGFSAPANTEHTIQMILDDSRSLLYTLSSKSTIRVFHISAKWDSILPMPAKADNKLDLVITKSLSQTLSDIGHKVQQTELISPKMRLVSINSISANEASRLNLMVTTSTGCRIFMSATSSMGSQITNYYSKAPNSMQVHHVKFPPPSNPTSSNALGNTRGVDTGSRSLIKTRLAIRYPPGYFFCFASRDAEAQSDTLFVSAPDPGRIARPPEPSMATKFSEFGSWVDLGSRAEDIGLMSPPFSAASTPVGFANELAVQFDSPVSEIAILTCTGIHTFRRRRLVDVFASTIRLRPGDEGLEGEVKKFIRLYGRSETAATALAVACGQGLDVTPDERVASITDPDILSHARTSFIEFGGKPIFDGNSIVDQSMPLIDTVRPSPRHEGLALYLSRLVRSVWKGPILQESVLPTGGLLVSPTVSLVKLRDVQTDLTKLKEFLDMNKSFIDGLAGPESLGRTSTRQEEISLQAEHRALHALVMLIKSILEGISFVQVLFDERIEDIMVSLPDDTRQMVRELTFESLYCSQTGEDIAHRLIKAIVDRNIANGSNVDTIAEALERRCGRFCSAGDVVIFKAQEQLKRAAEAGSNSEFGRNLLNESLRLFKQVVEQLSMEQLQWATEQYVAMEFYGGAIELALNVAKQLDRSNRAMSWIVDGRPEEDPRAADFAKRSECYVLVHFVINALDQASVAMPDMMDGQFTLASKRRAEAYNVIDTSEDEAFQTDLYDWYLAQDQSYRLLQVQSPYIVTYLQRKSLEDIAHADLLWKYYSQANRPQDAARVQLELAKGGFELSLNRRIEYLSRAKANASTNMPGIGRQSRLSLLREVSDLLDVANIQDDLVEKLKGDPRWAAAPERKQEVLRILDGQIQTLSELYNSYTESAEYYDLCILIYHAADHRNPVDIRNTWLSLIDKTHTQAAERDQGQPYEAVVDVVRSLGIRLNLSESSFPIGDLVPLLERYAFEHQRGVGPVTWVADLFLDLQVPCENLFPILEDLFYADEAPFTGTNKRVIANDMLYVAQRWFQESSRGQARLFGSDSNAAAMLATLQFILQNGLSPEKVEECQVLRMRIVQLMR